LKLKISIIGAGAFGLSAALVLSENKNLDITIYEKNNKILDGATFANHNRHHYGFHYPRSEETIQEINISKNIFEFYFKKSCLFNFPNFYAISKNNSKISSDLYENFLIQNNLEYKSIPIDKKIFNKNIIDKVFQVNEGIYEFTEMKKVYESRLKKSKVKIKLCHKLVDADINKKNILKFETIKGRKVLHSDVVINATYANFNDIISLFRLKNNKSEYNLQEFAIISFKNNDRIGLTVMDGNFPSVLPIGNTHYHLLAHVSESQLIKEINLKNNLYKNNYIFTNYNLILNESKKYLSLLENSIYHRSLLSSRVVVKNTNDTRTSDIIEHGKGFYSIFGAKIISSQYIAIQLAQKINSL